jgi:predicted phage terminase large subunit-like protein
METAQYAELGESVNQSIGKTNSLLTMTTTLGKFAGCSATTVMRGLDTLELSVWHLPLQNTSQFTAEQIVSIELDGEEEVFDVQVDDTENFIANGLVSHNTWWHADDWAGRIQEAMNAGDGDKFEIIRYPAINEYGDEFILPDDSIQEIPPGNPVPPGSRLTRYMDTAVHPARYTTEAMKRIKRNLTAGGQKRVWDALYQQNPIPDEGNFFGKEMFRFYGSQPDHRELYIYQAWDFAISEGKESDYTVGMCIGVDHRDNVYVLDVRRFRSGDSFLIVDTILDFARDYDANALGFEDGQIWKAIESQFTKRCEERRQFPSYEVLKPLTDKMVRANPLRGRMQLGKVFFDKQARWFTELLKELLHFPAGKHDDQVDALSWAIRLTLSRIAPRQKDYQPKSKSWKDDLGRYMGKGDVTHMAS